MTEFNPNLPTNTPNVGKTSSSEKPPNTDNAGLSGRSILKGSIDGKHHMKGLIPGSKKAPKSNLDAKAMYFKRLEESINNKMLNESTIKDIENLEVGKELTIDIIDNEQTPQETEEPTPKQPQRPRSNAFSENNLVKPQTEFTEKLKISKDQGSNRSDAVRMKGISNLKRKGSVTIIRESKDRFLLISANGKQGSLTSEQIQQLRTKSRIAKQTKGLGIGQSVKAEERSTSEIKEMRKLKEDQLVKEKEERQQKSGG